jgi:phosphoadenosine phosphosulfate reductase
MTSMALGRLRDNEPPEGYHLSFSGGKDSIVCHALAVEAGVKFTAHMGMTSVDPPEVLRFVRENYPGVVLHKPRLSMFQLMARDTIPPWRRARYCCRGLKEYLGAGTSTVTGIRHEESPRRRGRLAVEKQKNKTGGVFIHPIIEWSSDEVWAFIKQRALAYPSLYDNGYSRIGCILCPMMGEKQKQRDIRNYPKFVAAYKLAIGRMLENRSAKGKPRDRMFVDTETCFGWWVSGAKWSPS